MKLLVLLFLLAAAAVHAQPAPASSQPDADAPSVSTDTQRATLPPPATDPSYRIVAGDNITLTVYGEPDLGASQRVDSSGKIRLPLLGEVVLMGKSIREAEQILERLYKQREFLKSPLVNLNVSAYALREVTVLGSVRSPGNLSFPNEATSLDIVDVITRVGGFNPSAKSDSVTVTRRLADGKEATYNLDVARMMSGRRGGDGNRREFSVLPGDRIWVPERLF